MTGYTANRLARLERAEREAHLYRLRATERPDGLPVSPAADWTASDLGELWRSIEKAREAGAGRPLGWMSTEDLLVLRDQVSAGGEASP